MNTNQPWLRSAPAGNMEATSSASASAQPQTDYQQPGQPSASSSNPVLVYSLEPGTGGTFVLGFDEKRQGGIIMGDVRYTGFEQCNTELGVYFSIGTDRCFCARIMVLPWANPTYDNIPRRYHDVIVHRLMWKLEEEATRNGWKYSDVNVDSLRMLSSHRARENPNATNGVDLAADAVLRFLNGANGPEDEIIYNIMSNLGCSHGYITEPGCNRSSAIEFLSIDTMANQGYAAVKHPLVEADSWKYEHEHA